MHANHAKRLTFLWCVPRSVSTAFEKMMACSGTFNVCGEPFIDIYKKSLLSAADFQDAQHEFQSQCEALTVQSRKHPVFVKDMGYHAEPFISDSFIRSVNNTFLIRDPRLSIPSLYRMRPDYAEDQPGFEGQYKLLAKVKKVTGVAPYVMDGELLKRHAAAIVPDYFRYIGHEFSDDILAWPSGARDDWAGRESWHVDAINSQGFENKPRPFDLTGLPTRVIESIDRNMYFYEQMKEQLTWVSSD